MYQIQILINRSDTVYYTYVYYLEYINPNIACFLWKNCSLLFSFHLLISSRFHNGLYNDCRGFLFYMYKYLNICFMKYLCNTCFVIFTLCLEYCKWYLFLCNFNILQSNLALVKCILIYNVFKVFLSTHQKTITSIQFYMKRWRYIESVH